MLSEADKILDVEISLFSIQLYRAPAFVLCVLFISQN